MQSSLAVVERQMWARRAFFMDVVAVGVMLIAAVFLMVDLYLMGRVPSEGLLTRIAVEAIFLIASFAWIAFRLLAAGYRSATRPTA
jgi:hypothetical protein